MLQIKDERMWMFTKTVAVMLRCLILLNSNTDSALEACWLICVNYPDFFLFYFLGSGFFIACLLGMFDARLAFSPDVPLQ